MLVLFVAIGLTARQAWLQRETSSKAGAIRTAEPATDDAVALAQALVAADAAIDQQPKAAAPHLSRALVLERLGLLDAAAQELDRWTQLENDKDMVAKMSQRHAALHRASLDDQWSAVIPALRSAAARGDQAAVSRIVSTFPQHARTYAEGPFLTEWADAFDRGAQTQAATALALVRMVARALRELHDDQFLSDAVASIERVPSAQQAVLASGQKRYDEGRRRIARRDVVSAVPLLDKARIAFESGGSPMALAAAQFHAAAVNDMNDLSRARQLVEQLHVPDRYPARRGEVAWLRGTIIGSGGALYAALVSYREAERTFTRLGESSLAAMMADLAAHVLVRLGRDGEAAQLRHDAFQRASANGDLAAVESMLTQAASDAYYAGQFDVARSYYRLALDCRVPNPNRRRRVLNLLGSALCDAHAGDAERAAAAIARASATAMALPAALREAALHDVEAVRALIERERDPASAYALLSDSVEFAKQNKPIHLPRLLVERARAARLAGRTNDALRDLADAIDTIEARRLEIVRDELRDTFLGSSLDAYAEMYDLAEAAGDYERAFATAERQRGRIFQERFGEPLISPPTLESVVRALDERTAILHYTVLPDRVVMLVLTSRGTRHASVRITKQQLLREVERFREDVRVSTTAHLPSAEALGRTLLRPIHNAMATAENLVVIPDEAVAAVPFGALRADDGRFAAERWIVSVSPSVAEYLRNASAANSSASRRRACVIGDPAFDGQRYAELPRLPAAAREAVTIATLYGTTALLGAEATRSAFETGFSSSDVMHLATHALLQHAQPERSGILLSDGELTIADVAARASNVAGIVVLAGCRTAVKSRRNELSSVANAFLAAGSRSVIATLWDLPDGGAHRFVRAPRPPRRG